MNKVRHLKKGDNVVALSGVHKGKSGKVLEVNQAKALVKVEGIGLVKKHTKPTQSEPKGGIVEKNRWMHACTFQVCDSSGRKMGRVGYVEKENGEKLRVFSSDRKKH